jgi:hypothetical protein
MSRLPFRAAEVAVENGSFWGVLENRWGGALVGRCATEVEANTLCEAWNRLAALAEAQGGSA